MFLPGLVHLCKFSTIKKQDKFNVKFLFLFRDWERESVMIIKVVHQSLNCFSVLLECALVVAICTIQSVGKIVSNLIVFQDQELEDYAHLNKFGFGRSTHCCAKYCTQVSTFFVCITSVSTYSVANIITETSVIEIYDFSWRGV